MKLSAAVALQIPGLPDAPQLFVHGEQDRFVSRCLRRDGIWEPYETSLVQAFLRPGDVFVDVGANIGYFSLLAAALVGQAGAVLAVEPDPANCRLLRASLALNGFSHRVQLLEGALAARAGEGRLFLSEENFGDHQVYPAEDGREAVAISLYNGSDWLRARARRLDLLKVDTQGAEFEVMTGLMPFLRGLDRPPRIMIELTPFSLRRAGASGRALVELLATLGQPHWIIDHVEHRLAPCSAEALAVWCDNVDGVEGDRGFMNILVGPGL